MDAHAEDSGGRPSRLVVLACLAGGGYILAFAAVDALLEAHAPTSQQMLIRLVLIALALLGALAVLIQVLLRERAAAAEADRRIQESRLEGALLTLRELRLTNRQRPVVPDSDVLAAHPEAAVLTPREREVAMLIAHGYTSKQIAEALVITERTADTHADRIRAKLDLRSRTEIAAWVLGNGLVSIGQQR